MGWRPEINQQALDLFFDRWMNKESAELFQSFLALDKHYWGSGRYLGAKSSPDIQNTVTLLKHVAHAGLDVDWITHSRAEKLLQLMLKFGHGTDAKQRIHVWTCN